MRRLLPIASALLCAALLLPGVGDAKRKSHAYRSDGLVKISDVVLVDAKGDGASPGDVYTFTITRFDKTGGHKTGRGHGYCVLGAAPFAICTAVIGDGKGKVVLTWEDNSNTKSFDVAITGGTRKYRNLRGDGTGAMVDVTTYRVTLRGTL